MTADLPSASAAHHGENCESAKLPRVAVFSLGGTIATVSDEHGHSMVSLDGPNLIGQIPEAATVADTEVYSAMMLPSGNMRLSDLVDLRSRLEQAVESGVRGIVVSQGTDTLEETSYALELLTSFDVPVVVTGAMRSASTAGYDGPANLLAAVRVAASPQARGLGVLVVFNDEIHHARYVRKQHATSPAAFASPDTGPLGWVIGNRVRLMTRPVGRFSIALPKDAPDMRVAQLRVYFDDDGRLVRAVPSLGFDGLVLAAFGAGYVPEWFKPILREVARQLPVVVTTRTDAGETPRYVFGAPGSDLADLWQDLIPAAGLDAVHATVLLRLLLMARVKPDRLRDCFEQAAHPCGSVVVHGD